MASAPTLNKVSPPGLSGSLRFPGYSLKEKTFEGTLHLLHPDHEVITYGEMMDRALELSAWLQSEERQHLVLDAMPDKYYLAEIEGELSLDPEKWLSGCVILKFTLQPFAYAKRETKGQVTLAAGTPKALTLGLPGTASAPVNARVTAKAALSWLQITNGSEFLRLESLGMKTGDKLEISATPEAYELMAILVNGVPRKATMTKESKEPFLATPGQVALSLSASGACDVEIALRARWK